MIDASSNRSGLRLFGAAEEKSLNHAALVVAEDHKRRKLSATIGEPSFRQPDTGLAHSPKAAPPVADFAVRCHAGSSIKSPPEMTSFWNRARWSNPRRNCIVIEIFRAGPLLAIVDAWEPTSVEDPIGLWLVQSANKWILSVSTSVDALSLLGFGPTGQSARVAMVEDICPMEDLLLVATDQTLRCRTTRSMCCRRRDCGRIGSARSLVQIVAGVTTSARQRGA